MSTFDHWRDQLLHAVADARLLGRPRRMRLASGHWALEGMLRIASRTVTIALVVDPLFENKLPIVLLQPWDALGFIPHVDPSGVICYLDPEGMLLDQRRQLQIVRDCLAEVQRTLLAGVTGANRADFVDEFEVYWQYLAPRLTAISSLDAHDLVTAAFTEAGFSLSGRYRFTEDELRRQGASYPSVRCPVCGYQADRSN